MSIMVLGFPCPVKHNVVMKSSSKRPRDVNQLGKLIVDLATGSAREPAPDANYRFEQQRFRTAQEPLYLRPGGGGRGTFEVVGEYEEARVRDTDSFVSFLRNPGTVRRVAR